MANVDDRLCTYGNEEKTNQGKEVDSVVGTNVTVIKAA